MIYVRRWYSIISILSIDVVAGAIASAIFFSFVFATHIEPTELIALGLTVWVIYTADHLSDAKKIRHAASTARHRFHQQHAKRLKSFLALALLLDGMTVLFINPEVIRWGVILSFVVLIFLIVQQSIPWLKEVSIAIFYTAGVLLPTIAHLETAISLAHFLLIIQFALVALINLLLFSWFDKTSDRLDGLKSLVTVAGESNTRFCIIVLSVLQLAVAVVHYLMEKSHDAYLLVSVMGIILLLIFLLEKKYSDHSLSRFLGEAVFILPILYLL